MEQQLQESLCGKEGNYILPFLWMKDGNHDKLAKQVAQIYDSGVRAFCVESRTHQTFCEQEWWDDLALILREAEQRDMKVWILDDKHFPTGYANGLAATKYPHLQRHYLVEFHVDVMGPAKQQSFLLHPKHQEDELLGVYLYQRTGNGEELCGTPINVTAHVKGNFLYVDIPEGCHRIFYYYKSRKGVRENQLAYINLIDKESVQVLLEAVYEPHYRQFKQYFGSTIAGFFSDEPSLGNLFFNTTCPDPGLKNRTLGLPGLAMPWCEELHTLLNTTYQDGLQYLAALWYDYRDIEKEFRYTFMDSVTSLYRKNFSFQLGDWCRAHNVQYIGHIIEDMNAHARLSCSNGHFFRSMDGQDMSGMDVVLHQILPGFANYMNSGTGSMGMMDPEFYHYSLAQLCASMARLNPQMQGRAMCETFGAYGWAEGVPMMKWLMDHLLIRGINHFVPHAFSHSYPHRDCPPHFYADGNDPQYEGFCALMRYTNKMSHLLSNTKSNAHIAVLYHGEAEWMNTKDCMMMQRPAKVLTDAHLAFEFVPTDYLTQLATFQTGAFCINDLTFTCLLVPYAKDLPAVMLTQLAQLAEHDIATYMVLEEGQTTNVPMQTILLSDLVAQMESMGLREIALDKPAPLLRTAHFSRDNAEIYFFFNESMQAVEEMTLTLPHKGYAILPDLLNGGCYAQSLPDGCMTVSLHPYESQLVVFDTSDDTSLSSTATQLTAPIAWSAYDIAPTTWKIALLEQGVDTDFVEYKETQEPFENITYTHPNFSGKMRYTTTLSLDTVPEHMAIDFGEVGQIMQLEVNGTSLGCRIVPPYRFDVSDIIQTGENTIIATVGNTLVHRMQDAFSPYLSIPPSGIMGPIQYYKG